MPTAGMSKSGAIETRHEMVGVILVTLALLFVLSLLSYSPRDPLLFQDSLYTEQTSNLIGKVGMTLGTGAFRLIGGASYLLPLALAVLNKTPTVWDETRLLGGTPGQEVYLARRSGGTRQLSTR